MAIPKAPYLHGVYVVPERVTQAGRFPFNVPALVDLELTFESAVTFFVGENGTGKSTLIEALAVLSDLPVSGGGLNETAAGHGPENDSEFASACRPVFQSRPKDGYFLRAEFYAHFASLLDQRQDDPDFRDKGGRADPYRSYGGRSLHTRSHGEAFLALIENRINAGIVLMDEPESALSPQRQLALLTRMADLVDRGATQFVIATHSPILLTFPEAEILSFDDGRINKIALEDSSHYKLTRGILEHPQRFWKHLRSED